MTKRIVDIDVKDWIRRDDRLVAPDGSESLTFCTNPPGWPGNIADDLAKIPGIVRDACTPLSLDNHTAAMSDPRIMYARPEPPIPMHPAKWAWWRERLKDAAIRTSTTRGSRYRRLSWSPTTKIHRFEHLEAPRVGGLRGLALRGFCE